MVLQFLLTVGLGGTLPSKIEIPTIYFNPYTAFLWGRLMAAFGGGSRPPFGGDPGGPALLGEPHGCSGAIGGDARGRLQGRSKGDLSAKA